MPNKVENYTLKHSTRIGRSFGPHELLVKIMIHLTARLDIIQKRLSPQMTQSVESCMLTVDYECCFCLQMLLLCDCFILLLITNVAYVSHTLESYLSSFSGAVGPVLESRLLYLNICN